MIDKKIMSQLLIHTAHSATLEALVDMADAVHQVGNEIASRELVSSPVDASNIVLLNRLEMILNGKIDDRKEKVAQALNAIG